MTAPPVKCYGIAVMPLPAHHARRRLAIVVLLTLLPWPAVWLGMYRLDSIVWTFFLYHGCCLLPAALWGRRLWRGAVRWPTLRQWAVLLAALVCVVPLSLFGYAEIGKRVLDAGDIPSIVTMRGFHATWLLPFGVYFVLVNAILEELFWRGVVLNELRGTSEAVWTVGAVWTAFTFAAWHYLVLRLMLRPRLGRGDRAGDRRGRASSSPGCTGRRARSSCRSCGTAWCSIWGWWSCSGR